MPKMKTLAICFLNEAIDIIIVHFMKKTLTLDLYLSL